MQQAPVLPAATPGEPAVQLSRASFAWAPGEAPTLRDVSLEARAGQVPSAVPISFNVNLTEKPGNSQEIIVIFPIVRFQCQNNWI